MGKNSSFSFIIILISLVSLEIYSIFLSYTNYGWWMPGFVFGLTLLNIIPLLFFIFKKTTIAYFVTCFIALTIVPNQLYQHERHFKLQEEASNVVNYIYEHKIRTGYLPDDIKKYQYRYRELKDQIEYSKYENNKFLVSYSVGTNSTTHYYNNSRGNSWEYYDD